MSKHKLAAMEKIEQMYKAKQAPCYCDLEAGLLEILEENKANKEVLKTVLYEISQVIAPRVLGSSDEVVLDKLDEFIERRLKNLKATKKGMH